MANKMFFIDLDGTTLRDDKSIPEENIAAIREMVEMGNYVAISTGRSAVSARPIAAQLQMECKGCFLITYNGALIYDLSDGTCLRDLRLPPEYASYVLREAKKAGIHAQAYSDTHVLTEQENREVQEYCRITNMPYQIVEDLSERTDISTPKVLLADFHDHEKLAKFQRDHKEWEKDRCVSFFSCPEYMEYSSLGATKASGIAFFEEYFSLRHEDTIAIGDEQNDVSMIRYAGIGAVMKNAASEVKTYADYVTERDNNSGGVAEVMRRFGL